MVVVLGASIVAATASCADQGDLLIRCPDAGGAVSVTDGQVTIDAVVMRVAAELTAPTTVADGMSFAIDLTFPDSPGTQGVRVECVRVAHVKENTRWDAVPRRTEESRDGSNAHVRSTDRDGPHWRPEDPVDVTIWLRTTSGRHVVTMGRQPIH